MPAVSSTTRNTSVYNPYQTLPVTDNKSSFFYLLEWVKNSAAWLCRRPAPFEKENEIKAELACKLNEFFMHGKDILTLNSNQQSVMDNFQGWIRQHQGTFTCEDQQIIKDYCQELRAIISPTANAEQRALLETTAGEIDKIADNIFADIRLVVGK